MKPLLGPATLTITDELVMVGERYYIRAVATYRNAEEGEELSATAYAREPLSKKGMDESQVTGAACVTNALLSWGRRVRFTSLSAQIGRIARDHGSADAAIADLVRCDLVVLDDLGAERATSVAEEGAYNVVNALYVARVPMVVTTNRTYAEMAASGDRVDRRIVERCQPVGF